MLELLSQLVVMMMMMMGARTRTLRFTCVTSRWTRDPEAQVLPWSQVSLNASPIKGNRVLLCFFSRVKNFPKRLASRSVSLFLVLGAFVVFF